MLLFLWPDRITSYAHRCWSWTHSHLIHQELLILQGLLLAVVILVATLLSFFGVNCQHAAHVLLVSTSVLLFTHAFFSDLGLENLIQLLMLGTCPILIAYVLDPCLLVFINTLLDVFFFLLQLELLTVIFNVISHSVHQSLNSFRSVLRFFLALLLFFESNAHVGLKLLSILLLIKIMLSLALLLFLHVLSNHLHRSFALLLLSLCLIFPFFVQLSSKSSHAITFVSLELFSIPLLLGLGFL